MRFEKGDKEDMQRAFSHVVRHQRAQGRPCMGPLDDFVGSKAECRYRYKGMACAFGSLIDDEDYSEDMENKTALQLIPRLWPALSTLDQPFEDSFHDLIYTLQQIHDLAPQHSWEFEWQRVAIRFGLKVPA